MSLGLHATKKIENLHIPILVSTFCIEHKSLDGFTSYVHPSSSQLLYIKIIPKQRLVHQEPIRSKQHPFVFEQCQLRLLVLSAWRPFPLALEAAHKLARQRNSRRRSEKVQRTPVIAMHR